MPESNNEETQPSPAKFDFSAYPPDSLFHERRTGVDRRQSGRVQADADGSPSESARSPRTRKDRRRRIDPTTFEKQYTDDEIEFMNAVQHFKVQSGKPFPSHGDVLRVASSLGYRKCLWEDEPALDESESGESEPLDVVILPV